MRCVEAPADSRLRNPVLEPREVVVIESEPPPYGLAIRKIEHLRSGQPLFGEVEQLSNDSEHGVRLAQRPVREPDAQINWPVLGAEHFGSVARRRNLARAERRPDERRER